MTIVVGDFFCGCGGTSAGLRAAGCRIAFGVDSDADAGATYKANFPEATFLEKDLSELGRDDLKGLTDRGVDDRLLFAGCAPCQPWSRQRKDGTGDEKLRPLLTEFGRMIEMFLPDLVLVENVPGIQEPCPTGPFRHLLHLLDNLEYHVDYGVLLAQDFGVPQRRKRLVLLGSRLAPISLPPATHGPGTSNPNYVGAWQTIAHLPAIEAGESHAITMNHRAAGLSPLNARRIAATPHDGSRLDWDEDLRLTCHKKTYTGHTDVYGRIRTEGPAPALTTRCISLSNGRYGHPTQNRAISVREAACLQTFREDFVFSGNLNSMARQIGNAVPVLMAQKIGESLIAHVSAARGGTL